jgi:hypothetical protein
MSVRISATDWKDGGLTDEDCLAIARAFAAAGADLIDVSTGQTVHDAEPIYGRMFQVPWSDMIRNEAGIATMCVGNITTADQVNTILGAGRADLVALGAPAPDEPVLHAAGRGAVRREGHRLPAAVEHAARVEIGAQERDRMRGSDSLRVPVVLDRLPPGGIGGSRASGSKLGHGGVANSGRSSLSPERRSAFTAHSASRRESPSERKASACASLSSAAGGRCVRSHRSRTESKPAPRAALDGAAPLLGKPADLAQA